MVCSSAATLGHISKPLDSIDGGGYVRLIKRRSHEPLVITSDVRDQHHKTAISHRDLIVAIVKYILFS